MTPIAASRARILFRRLSATLFWVCIGAPAHGLPGGGDDALQDLIEREGGTVADRLAPTREMVRGRAVRTWCTRAGTAMSYAPVCRGPTVLKYRPMTTGSPFSWK